MLSFGLQGFRVIAHDRRGHSRSSQTWDGNDMDTYADDLAALTEKLALKNRIHVGPLNWGEEVARYIGRRGSKCVGMAVLISAVPPLTLKTDKSPAGAPMSVFDGLRFVWTATVESIVQKLSRCRQTLEQIRPGCTLPDGQK
jgi:non-heme chloroperoxidase